MARCFVTRKLPGTAVQRLAAEHEVDVWTEDRRPARQELLERVREAEGLLPQLTERVDAELFDQTEYGPKYRIRGTLTGPNCRLDSLGPSR